MSCSVAAGLDHLGHQQPPALAGGLSRGVLGTTSAVVAPAASSSSAPATSNSSPIIPPHRLSPWQKRLAVPETASLSLSRQTRSTKHRSTGPLLELAPDGKSLRPAPKLNKACVDPNAKPSSSIVRKTQRTAENGECLINFEKPWEEQIIDVVKWLK